MRFNRHLLIVLGYRESHGWKRDGPHDPRVGRARGREALRPRGAESARQSTPRARFPRRWSIAARGTKPGCIIAACYREPSHAVCGWLVLVLVRMLLSCFVLLGAGDLSLPDVWGDARQDGVTEIRGAGTPYVIPLSRFLCFLGMMRVTHSE